MDSTSASLLERLRVPAHQEAWGRFVDLYTPLIYYWARRAGLTAEESADLVQDVLTVLVQKLPEFRYDPHKSFRGWLRSVTLNKWRENRRRRRVPVHPAGDRDLADMPGPEAEDAFWQVEYQQHLVGRALQLMQAEFQPNTWRACWECVVDGRPPAVVAQDLGLTVAAVYAAKSRVLRRLREELAGLLH
jgi:RNA polymerase sigma-70 factor (ECF subfamily)